MKDELRVRWPAVAAARTRPIRLKHRIAGRRRGIARHRRLGDARIRSAGRAGVHGRPRHSILTRNAQRTRSNRHNVRCREGIRVRLGPGAELGLLSLAADARAVLSSAASTRCTDPFKIHGRDGFSSERRADSASRSHLYLNGRRDSPRIATVLPTDHDESVMIAVPVPVTAIGTVPVTGLSRACLSSPEAAARASGWNLRARASGRPLRLGVLCTHWRCYQPPASRATRGRRTPPRPDDTPSSS